MYSPCCSAALALCPLTVVPVAAGDLQIGKPLAKTLAPAWDLRGPLTMPWQGVASAATWGSSRSGSAWAPSPMISLQAPQERPGRAGRAGVV